MEDPHVRAEANLYALSRMSYVGRGLVVGPTDDGKRIAQVSWISGRSENSRNRIYTADAGRVFTEAADPTKVKDPRLIIYTVMDEADGNFVVSNGNQTDAVIEELRNRWYRWPWRKRGWYRFVEAIEKHTYEPDAPNYTSRITGFTCLEPFCLAGLSILRKAEWDNNCIPSHTRYSSLTPGVGVCVTTYSGEPILKEDDGLPRFRDEPLLMPLKGDLRAITRAYWDRLNVDNRISVAVKIIDPLLGTSRVHIINKYPKKF